MTSTEHRSKSAISTFERLFSEAASLTFNIDCLQYVFVDTAGRDGDLLKQAMGDWVVLSRTEDPNVENDLSLHLVYGISVFKALRVELYLKALLASERKEFPKTHDLLDLFETLRYKTKQQLDELLKAAQDHRQQPSPPVIRMPSFRSIMEKHRDDFVAIRYGESLERRNARLRDGMMNLDSATDALLKACVHTPEGDSWLKNAKPGLGQYLGEKRA